VINKQAKFEAARVALCFSETQIYPRFVVLGGCSNRPFSKKAQNLCDVTIDMNIPDRAIQVGGAKEGQSFVFESITSELW
jgi:hypothetical protein